VDDSPGSRRQRLLRIPCPELVCQPEQARAEHEYVDPAPGPDRGVQEEQQRSRVGLHRARDVAEQDELARHLDAAAERSLDRVTATSERTASQASQVQAPAARMRAQ